MVILIQSRMRSEQIICFIDETIKGFCVINIYMNNFTKVLV